MDDEKVQEMHHCNIPKTETDCKTLPQWQMPDVWGKPAQVKNKATWQQEEVHTETRVSGADQTLREVRDDPILLDDKKRMPASLICYWMSHEGG